MLDALQALGCSLFLATSKPLLYARRILDHYALTSRFVGVHGAELDGTRADKTELIRHLLVTEQLDPAQCLMVGDRKHDIHGARANHVAVCSRSEEHTSELQSLMRISYAVFCLKK